MSANASLLGSQQVLHWGQHIQEGVNIHHGPESGNRPAARLPTFLFTFAIAQLCASETQSKTFASSTAL
jgi:hypothetical protein